MAIRVRVRELGPTPVVNHVTILEGTPRVVVAYMDLATKRAEWAGIGRGTLRLFDSDETPHKQGSVAEVQFVGLPRGDWFTAVQVEKYSVMVMFYRIARRPRYAYLAANGD